MWLFDHLSNTLIFNDSITFNIKPLCYFFICCSDLSVSVLSVPSSPLLL